MTTFNRSIAQDTKPFWIFGPLIFSGFYFMQSFIDFNHIPASKLVFILINFCIFISLHLKAVTLPGDKILPWLMVMTVFVGLATYFTYGTQSLYGYIAFVAAYTLPLKRALALSSFIALTIFVSGYFFTGLHPYYLTPAILTSVGLFSFGFFTKRDTQFRLKEQHNKKEVTQLAAIAERERIARDLHDIAGHHLSSIALKSELAEKYLANEQTDKAKQEIAEVAKISREILSDIRQTVSGLKSKSLPSVIDKLTRELKNHNFHVSLDNQLTDLDSKVESTLVLILTEATTNILRHSTGDNVAIALKNDDTYTTLTVSDNGNTKEFSEGNGLQGMRQRSEDMHGRITINTADGFQLIVQLPRKGQA